MTEYNVGRGGENRMKKIQVVWGYVFTLSALRGMVELLSLFFQFSILYLYLALSVLLLLLLRIVPSRESNYPLAFHMEIASLGFHLKA